MSDIKKLFYIFFPFLGGISEDRLELLCRDGSRSALTEWQHCNWGKVPADAVLTSSAASLEQRIR